MCCAGFPWAFGLPSTAAAQGNQPMISELRAVTLVPGLEPNARNAGEKRLAAGVQQKLTQKLTQHYKAIILQLKMKKAGTGQG